MKEILIIAYAFSPDKRVGAQRMSYWYKHLPQEMDAKITVITTEKKADFPHCHIVPLEGKSFFRKFIKDDGLIWKKNIRTFLEKNQEIRPDIVIITGGPFMHFALSIWLKKRYGAKVILDYRDPFAMNPGFANSKLKIRIKTYFEKRFNNKADALITVNKYCGKIIRNFFKKQYAIVQNGYDEQIQPIIKPVVLSENSNFVYAGKFYYSPETIQKAFENAKTPLTYLGPDEDQWQLPSDFIQSKGFLSYGEALEEIAAKDIGVIQIYGHPFQSTTKIFDYIRCKRAILIITNSDDTEGSVYDELDGYPNVFRARNEEQDIIRAIEEIKASTYTEPDDDSCSKNSRKNQLKNLIRLIQEVEK